jgi:hypothetical protein
MSKHIPGILPGFLNAVGNISKSQTGFWISHQDLQKALIVFGQLGGNPWVLVQPDPQFISAQDLDAFRRLKVRNRDAFQHIHIYLEKKTFWATYF